MWSCRFQIKAVAFSGGGGSMSELDQMSTSF